MRFRTRTLLLFVALCAVGIVSATALYRDVVRSYGTSGQGVTARSANRVVWLHLQLPDAASDVTYYTDFGACEAEFAITEESFLQWCRANGWQTTAISTPTPYFNPLWLQADTRQVSRGYRFLLPDGEGAFDGERSRACFWVSTFP